MEKWSFNLPLLSQLPEVLDTTCAQVAKRVGLHQQVLNRYMSGENDLNIEVLIQICNALRMPIYYFISENHNYIIPNRESATIPLSQWHPVSWNLANVKKIFGEGYGQIDYKDVAKAMHVITPSKPKERFTLRRRFKITDFLTACNAFDLSPFLFLNDPNRPDDTKPAAKHKKKSKPAPPPSYDELYNKVGELERTITDMQQKLDSLMKDHEALVRRVNSNIMAIHNYLGSVGDMAAEERKP